MAVLHAISEHNDNTEKAANSLASSLRERAIFLEGLRRSVGWEIAKRIKRRR